jgi:hypothetical protein
MKLFGRSKAAVASTPQGDPMQARYACLLLLLLLHVPRR